MRLVHWSWNVSIQLLELKYLLDVFGLIGLDTCDFGEISSWPFSTTSYYDNFGDEYGDKGIQIQHFIL